MGVARVAADDLPDQAAMTRRVIEQAGGRRYAGPDIHSVARTMNRRDIIIGGAALALPLPAVAATPAEWTPAAFHAARRFVDLPVGRIAWVERGSGPVAIFLHGYPLNGFQWRGAMARLAAHRRCVAIDLMGLGYSEVPEGTNLSPGAQCAMVVAFMDRMGSVAADLVSNDSATGIAQLIAADHPGRVR